MPTIRVEMFEGRTPEQKKNLVKAITPKVQRVRAAAGPRSYIKFHQGCRLTDMHVPPYRLRRSHR